MPKPNADRIRISMALPKVLLAKIRVRANEEGLPYQTWMQSILHKELSKPTLEERVAAIEREVASERRA